MRSAYKRIVSAFIILVFVLCSVAVFSPNAYATEESTSTTTTTTTSTATTTTTTTTTASTTTTTTAAPKNGVQISQVYCYGSNNKLYNQVIKFSELSETYTANVSIPLWMTSLQVNIKSVSDAKITCDGAEFSRNGSVFTHTFEFDAAAKYTKKTYTITIENGEKKSTLTFNLTQTVFETKLESVSVDSVAAEGNNESGYTYTLPEGTTSCRIKLKTRSEDTVTMGKAGETAEELELTTDKIYLEKVSLVEGENVFNITVSAPGTTISTTLTIYVGEPVVSSEVSSQPIVNEPVSDTDTSDTDVPPAPIIESSEPETPSAVEPDKSSGGEASPLIWILIGVVIAVVIGACIFMIASMGGSSSNSKQRSNNRQYDNRYRAPAPAPSPARRRDLGRYVDDEYGYDEYYDEPAQQSYNDGYYENDEYYSDEGYYQDGTFYDDYNRSAPVEPRSDRYERQPQRQQYQSQRRGNRNDFDDYYDDYYN